MVDHDRVRDDDRLGRRRSSRCRPRPAAGAAAPTPTSPAPVPARPHRLGHQHPGQQQRGVHRLGARPAAAPPPRSSASPRPARSSAPAGPVTPSSRTAITSSGVVSICTCSPGRCAALAVNGAWRPVRVAAAAHRRPEGVPASVSPSKTGRRPSWTAAAPPGRDNARRGSPSPAASRPARVPVEASVCSSAASAIASTTLSSSGPTPRARASPGRRPAPTGPAAHTVAQRAGCGRCRSPAARTPRPSPHPLGQAVQPRVVVRPGPLPPAAPAGSPVTPRRCALPVRARSATALRDRLEQPQRRDRGRGSPPVHDLELRRRPAGTRPARRDPVPGDRAARGPRQRDTCGRRRRMTRSPGPQHSPLRRPAIPAARVPTLASCSGTISRPRSSPRHSRWNSTGSDRRAGPRPSPRPPAASPRRRTPPAAAPRLPGGMARMPVARQPPDVRRQHRVELRRQAGTPTRPARTPRGPPRNAAASRLPRSVLRAAIDHHPRPSARRAK